ncbi:MAG: hypothetical protein ACXAB7_15150 [Candidatus Kariarchaeaceae archaeon]
MRISFRLPVQKSVLEGPPYQLVLFGKSKRFFRKTLLLTGFIWIVSIIIGTQFFIEDHLIFSFLLLLAFLTAHDKAIVISGDHGNWSVIQYRFNELMSLSFRKIKFTDISSEFRITNLRRSRGAFVILTESSKSISLMMRNDFAKELKDDFEILKIPVNVRKRGKMK